MNIKLINFISALLLVGLIVLLVTPKKEPPNNGYLFDFNSHEHKNE